MAAWIMSLPIQRAIGEVNITFVTGESTSGKTSLVHGLLGGSQTVGHGVPSILEGARFSSDATAAWVYQEMTGSSLLLSLDEAETANKQITDHNTRVYEIQHMLYSIPTGGATFTRGGTSPDQRIEYHLRMPVIMAGIDINPNPTFLTRVMVVYTQKDATRRSIDDYIETQIGSGVVANVRRDLTVCLLPYIPELYARKVKLYDRLSKIQTPVIVTSRFIISVLTVLTVYEFLGFDPEEMYKSIVAKSKHRLETIQAQDFQSDIINAVLYTEAVKTTLDASDSLSGFVSARTLILDGEHVVLNNSNCGVYLIPQRGWIVIVWRQVRFTILGRSTYRAYDEASLREGVAKNAFVLTEISKDDHAFIQSYLHLSDIKNSTGYTVLDSEYILSNTAKELRRTNVVTETAVEITDAEEFIL
jgi:hypothetical protein